MSTSHSNTMGIRVNELPPNIAMTTYVKASDWPGVHITNIYVMLIKGPMNLQAVIDFSYLPIIGEMQAAAKRPVAIKTAP